MRIFNEVKTEELSAEQLDYERGYLKPDKLFVAHHDAVDARKQVSHYEVVKEYPNGGKDVKEVIDVPATEAKEAYDEYEDIQVYVPYTEEELKKRVYEKRYAELKVELVKIKEDIEQETFGIIRDDYVEKKSRAATIINELRVLEGKEPRLTKTK